MGVWQILCFWLAFTIRLRWVWVYVVNNVWCWNCLSVPKKKKNCEENLTLVLSIRFVEEKSNRNVTLTGNHYHVRMLLGKKQKSHFPICLLIDTDLSENKSFCYISGEKTVRILSCLKSFFLRFENTTWQWGKENWVHKTGYANNEWPLGTSIQIIVVNFIMITVWQLALILTRGWLGVLPNAEIFVWRKILLLFWRLKSFPCSINANTKGKKIIWDESSLACQTLIYCCAQISVVGAWKHVEYEGYCSTGKNYALHSAVLCIRVYR